MGDFSDIMVEGQIVLSMALLMTVRRADASLCRAKFESVFETQSPRRARHVRCTVRGSALVILQ